MGDYEKNKNNNTKNLTPVGSVDNPAGINFIQAAVNEDIKSNRFSGIVHTRFPPEPNGYLHIGHAKAMTIDFAVAKEYNGKCNLRFDDTNPAKEEDEYVNAIISDVKWLGFDFGDKVFYASDYFEQTYQYAVDLIKKGKAYVDDLTADEIRQYRGTLTVPGKNSPYRDRSVEENIDIFTRMRNGDYPDGSKVLRAKIDMASPNMNLRDPVMYRILHTPHHRTGDNWCIYPMYDWAHGLEDSIEGITHSLCSLEYEIHRPLYDWFLDELGIYHPRQIEFARLNLSYTVMSKRKLLELVKAGIVSGWDDPRMPTLSGLRRRGYTPESIKAFCARIGVAKADSIVDIALLEHCLREDLNKNASRAMVVLNPLKVVIVNYPKGKTEEMEADNNPENPEAGKRKIPFSGEIYIEKEDFRENPPKDFFRLAPGREIRLKHAYYIKCVDVIKNSGGEITELHCTYDPESRGGWTNDGRKVMGTSHWVSIADAVDIEVRLYERLFTKENPDDVEEGHDYKEYINPASLSRLTGCKAEPGLANSKPGDIFQFLRQGYFCADPDSGENGPVFNRTAGLADSWAKKEKKK